MLLRSSLPSSMVMLFCTCGAKPPGGSAERDHAR